MQLCFIDSPLVVVSLLELFPQWIGRGRVRQGWATPLDKDNDTAGNTVLVMERANTCALSKTIEEKANK